jgi:hypothetical protein
MGTTTPTCPHGAARHGPSSLEPSAVSSGWHRLGLLASVPMLIKLRRRFSNWWAPAIALAVFTAMFLLSAFVIGPLISSPAGAGPAVPPIDHASHHAP